MATFIAVPNATESTIVTRAEKRKLSRQRRKEQIEAAEQARADKYEALSNADRIKIMERLEGIENEVESQVETFLEELHSYLCDELDSAVKDLGWDLTMAAYEIGVVCPRLDANADFNLVEIVEHAKPLDEVITN